VQVSLTNGALTPLAQHKDRTSSYRQS
jgi:hypothetical protein